MVNLDLADLHSPGTVASALLDATGAWRPLTKYQSDPRYLGYATSALYGGLTGVRRVREPIRVLSFDAPRQYARVASAIGVGRHLAAYSIRVRHRGVTEQAQQLLAIPGSTIWDDPRFDLWSRAGFWFLAVRSRFDSLPHKARYNAGADEWILADNPIEFDGVLWWSIFDVALSKIATGRIPEIVDGIQFVPYGVKEGLRPVRIRGGRQARLDGRFDLYQALVAATDRVRRDRRLPECQRVREADHLKLVTEAAAFGQLARFDPPIGTAGGTVYGPWGPVVTATPLERPGPWCWPPAAAAVCAGARLLLTLAVYRSGKMPGFEPIAFDTDSVTFALLDEARGAV